MPSFVSIVTEPRPVVLVGSLEVEIRSYLVKHGSTSDIKFCYCKRGVVCVVCVSVESIFSFNKLHDNHLTPRTGGGSGWP